MTLTTVSAEEATDIIRRLLAVTATGDGDLGDLIDVLGPDHTARVLLDEILFRACLEDFAGAPVSVTIALTHRGEEFASTVASGPETALPAPVVRQDLAEAAAALFGPPDQVSALTRTIRWPGPDVVFPMPGRPAVPTVFYAVVQRVTQVLDRREPTDLTELAVRYGADKWGAMHRYTDRYERHFSPYRDQRVSVLEIGVGGFDDPAEGGASLRMWKRYFRRGLVYGLDILDKGPVSAGRMTTVRADQSNVEQLAEAAGRFGPFDIVIDDGSHVSRHVITTFHTLFPYVRPGGLYVVEDLHTSYWPEWFEGSDTDLNDPDFTVGFLKTLLDGLHHEEFLRPDAREPQPTDTEISAVHVYHNLAFIEKGSNTEGSMAAMLLRAERAGRGDQKAAR